MSFLALRNKQNQRPLQLFEEPTVTTQAVTGITSSQATGNGTVVQDGGSADTVRGFVYSSVTLNPTLSDSVQTAGSGVGVYNATLAGLTSSTTYYVRAYATNAIGTGYGDAVSFVTNVGVTITDPIFILSQPLNSSFPQIVSV